MARFIPIEKMTKLREAARSGDEQAKAILRAQLNDEDFDLDGYFAPKPELEIQEPVEEAKATEPAPETPFQMYIRENGIILNDDNRAEVIAEFENMTGNKAELPEMEATEPVIAEEENLLDMQSLIDDELEAISGYEKFYETLVNANLCEEKKALIQNKIDKIIADEKQHIDILKGLECILDEKHENIVENEEITE